MSNDYPSGIAGLEPREPYGAVLSIGVKGDRGNPVEKDRFHILEPLPQKRGRDLVRAHHPRFASFNTARPELRRMVFCQLVHATRDECFDHHLLNYLVKGYPVHPQGLPFCVGNGITAKRYTGFDEAAGVHRFADIACPHDRCEFRQPPQLQGGRRGPVACKPWMKLLFRLVWPPKILADGTEVPSSLPAVETLFTSASWNTTKRALGLFKAIDDRAKMILGDRSYSLGGFVFSMTLGEKTNPQEQSRFPVVDFAPATDPIEFFERQLDRTKRVAEILGPERSLLTEGPATRAHSNNYLAHIPGTTVDVSPGASSEGDNDDR